MPACSKTDRQFCEVTRKPYRVVHLRCEHLQLEYQSEAREQPEPAPPVGVVHEVRTTRETLKRVHVPVKLLANAAHIAYAGLLVESVLDIGRRKVGVGNDRVRVASPVGLRLHPPRLVERTLGRPVCLDIDRLRDVLAARIAEILLDRIVAHDRRVLAEDPRLHRPVEPRDIRPVPDEVVRVDGRLKVHSQVRP